MLVYILCPHKLAKQLIVSFSFNSVKNIEFIITYVHKFCFCLKHENRISNQNTTSDFTAVTKKVLVIDLATVDFAWGCSRKFSNSHRSRMKTVLRWSLTWTGHVLLVLVLDKETTPTTTICQCPTHRFL